VVKRSHQTTFLVSEQIEGPMQVIGYIRFVRQPELSTAGPHGKLLLAIYSYFAEVEREFISVRTQQGLAAARATGKRLGRPKGAQGEPGQGAGVGYT
jgi:hypothetical protein